MGLRILGNHTCVRALIARELLLLWALVLPAALQAQEAGGKPANSATVGKGPVTSMPAKQAPVTKQSSTADSATPEPPAQAPAPPTLTLDTVRETIAGKDFDLALEQLAEIATVASKGLNPREHGTLVADCHYAKGDLAKAGKLYAALTEGDDVPQDTWQVHAWEQLTACYLASGDTGMAEQAMAHALELFPAVTREAGKTTSVYYRNRAELDAVPDYPRVRLTEFAAHLAASGETARAAQAYLSLVFRFPNARGHRAMALRAGDLLRAKGALQEARVCYLRCLRTGRDRCFGAKANLSDNQRYLDEVAKPPAEDLVASALVGLNQCERLREGGYALADEQQAQFVDAWYSALCATYAPLGASSRQQWYALGGSVGASPWSSLCQLETGQSLLRDGQYAEARKCFEKLRNSAEMAPGLQPWADLGAGLSCLSLREFGDASVTFQAAAQAADRALASEATLALARCREQQFAWAEARKAFGELVDATCVDAHRRLAAHALERLAEREKMPAASAEAGVSVLPDDRTTHGDWPLGYGLCHYVLCAQNYVADRIGGSGPQLTLSFSTCSETEPGRLWVSATKTQDPAALWDPIRRHRLPANRDDRGEQIPIGAGPDLRVTCGVPAGDYILALYFVNDSHYYEPSRHYSLDITSDGELVAVTDVSDFGGGVYKRFRVSGPRTLTVRSRRDVSLNVLLSGVFLDPLPTPRSLPEGIVEHDWGSTELGQGIRAAWHRTEELRSAARFRDAEAAFDSLVRALCSNARAVRDLLETPQGLQALRELCSPSRQEARRPLLRDHLYPPGTSRGSRLWAGIITALSSTTSAEDLKVLAPTIVGAAAELVPGLARLRLVELIEERAPGTVLPAPVLSCASRRLRLDGEDAGALAMLERVAFPGLSPSRRARVLAEMAALARRLSRPETQIAGLLAKLDACGCPEFAQRTRARVAVEQTREEGEE